MFCVHISQSISKGNHIDLIIFAELKFTPSAINKLAVLLQLSSLTYGAPCLFTWLSVPNIRNHIVFIYVQNWVNGKAKTKKNLMILTYEIIPGHLGAYAHKLR